MDFLLWIFFFVFVYFTAEPNHTAASALKPMAMNTTETRTQIVCGWFCIFWCHNQSICRQSNVSRKAPKKSADTRTRWTLSGCTDVRPSGRHMCVTLHLVPPACVCVPPYCLACVFAFSDFSPKIISKNYPKIIGKESSLIFPSILFSFYGFRWL